jgi:hypothetical protein
MVIEPTPDLMSGQLTSKIDDDTQLAAKITEAVKDLDSAIATKNEKAVAAGRLLAEAQKRYPTDRAFEKFLRLAGGVGIRRARELIAIALGRKNFEQHQAENRAAQQRHRDKLKADKIEREKAAARPKPDQPKPSKGKPQPDAALRNAASDKGAAARSAASLIDFQLACETHLRSLNEADLKTAIVYVNSGAWKRREAA